VRPDEGSHPKPTANTTWSSSPNQNAGSETPAVAMAVIMRSNPPPRRAAAKIPAGSVNARAMTIDVPTSSSVAGRRSATRSTTGRPSLKL
jgi:hypothetical protein